MEADNDVGALKMEMASLQRENARIKLELEQLQETCGRLRAKVTDKKGSVADLKREMERMTTEHEQLKKSASDKEQIWQAIRKELMSRRDDAIKESCKMRRQNEKLKNLVHELRRDKSNVLLRLWERKQTEKETASHWVAGTRNKPDKLTRPNLTCGLEENLQAKVMSLELRLYRQARLVELLLDIVQEHEPNFSSDQRRALTSAFLDNSRPT